MIVRSCRTILTTASLLAASALLLWSSLRTPSTAGDSREECFCRMPCKDREREGLGDERSQCRGISCGSRRRTRDLALCLSSSCCTCPCPPSPFDASVAIRGGQRTGRVLAEVDFRMPSTSQRICVRRELRRSDSAWACPCEYHMDPLEVSNGSLRYGLI